jgi:hypothetical protein
MTPSLNFEVFSFPVIRCFFFRCPYINRFCGKFYFIFYFFQVHESRADFSQKSLEKSLEKSP